MNYTDELPDLNIEITGITFTPTLIKITALPVYSRKKNNEFLFQISRALNETTVTKLVIGNEYRITQERIVTGRKVNYRWTSIKCLNDRQQKAQILAELFE